MLKKTKLPIIKKVEKYTKTASKL